MALQIAPFDGARYLGSVIRVDASSVRINTPIAMESSSSRHAGHRIGLGEVGEFVAIEGELHAIIGRIIEVRIPDAERLAVEPTREFNTDGNPTSVVQLLMSVDLRTGSTSHGIAMHPRVGQYVYSAHPDLIRHAFEDQSSDPEYGVDLAHLVNSRATRLIFSPTQLFGRHCAILGATGGGKSWTVARLLGEVARHKGKAVLFDPSGEFSTLSDRVRHVYLGKESTGESEDDEEIVGFPYRHLSEGDLFAMFRPSGGVQAPKLRDALKSLKLLAIEPSLGHDGLLKKAKRSRKDYESALRARGSAIRNDGSDYNASMLANQILEECVWPTLPNDPSKWGDYDKNAQGYCVSLVSRIEVLMESSQLSSIFSSNSFVDVTSVLDEFLSDNSISVLRISMEHLPYEHNTRELVANALGRYLLGKARAGSYLKKPLLVALDEAHEFLNRSVGEEGNRTWLDSFGLIAKEGRKFGLLSLLATQRPRDIPQDVLSQVGKFIIHRLSNDQDRQVIERACGDLDSEALRFLPTLGLGEALVIGQGIPSAVPIQVHTPRDKPDSEDIALW